MRFYSFIDNQKITVTPGYQQTMDGVRRVYQRGLRVRFVNHHFDSELAQRNLGWTDDERTQVERALLQHVLFGRSRGIYLDDKVDDIPAMQVRPRVKPSVPAVEGEARCIVFRDPGDGTVEQCGNRAEEGSNFCADHEQAQVAS